MKGYKEFVQALLPKVTDSAKMVFTPNGVKSAVKVMDGNLLITSSLKTDNTIEDTIAIPNLSDLSKAIKIMGDFDLGIVKVNDTPSKLQLKNEFSKVGLFLMDGDYLSYPELAKEPAFVVDMEIPVTHLNSLKSMYGLIDGDVTILSITDKSMSISVGKQSRNDSNSGKIELPVEADTDTSISVRSEALQSILSTIDDEDTVSISISEPMVKLSVKSCSDGYELSTDYYIVAVTD